MSVAFYIACYSCKTSTYLDKIGKEFVSDRPHPVLRKYGELNLAPLNYPEWDVGTPKQVEAVKKKVNKFLEKHQGHLLFIDGDDGDWYRYAYREQNKSFDPFNRLFRKPFEQWLKDLKAKGKNRRKEAVEIAGFLDHSEVIPSLLEILAYDPEVQVKIAAAESLGLLGAKYLELGEQDLLTQIVDALFSVLHDSDTGVRLAGLQALSLCQDDRAIEDLAQVLPQYPAEAIKGLMQLATHASQSDNTQGLERIVQAIRPYVNPSDLQLTVKCIQLLGACGTAGAQVLKELWLRMPEQEQFIKHSLKGYYLPQVIRGKSLIEKTFPGEFTLQAHSLQINSLAYSPDAKYLASGADNNLIKLWDTNSGAEKRMFYAHSASIRDIAFSPDGNHLASASADGTIRIWDVQSGQELQMLAGHAAPVKAVTFSPDGTLVASGSDDETVKIWETSSGKELHTLTGHACWVNTLAFHPGGKLLASGSADNTIKFWDINSGILLRTVEAPGWVSSLQFSPDGKILVSDGGNAIRLWSVAAGEQIQWFKDRWDRLFTFILSADGKYVFSSSQQHLLKVWSVDSYKSLTLFPSDNAAPLWTSFDSLDKGSSRKEFSSVNTIAIDPAGQFLALADNKGKIRILNMKERLQSHIHALESTDISEGSETRKEARDITHFQGHQDGVEIVTYSPNGNYIASAGKDKTIRLWDVGSGTELVTFSDALERTLAMVFSPDSRFLAAGGQGTNGGGNREMVRIWEIPSGRLLQTIEGKGGWINALAFMPDGGTLLSGTQFQAFKLWDITSGELLKEFGKNGHQTAITTIAYSPDGNYLASGCYGNKIKIWSMDNGVEVETLTGHKGTIQSLAFSPDGQFLTSAGNDQQIKFWDSKTLKEIKTFQGKQGSITRLAYSPDGQFLASAYHKGAIDIWDVQKEEKLHTLTGHTAKVVSVAFHPTGKWLVSASEDKTLKLWNVWTGKEIKTFKGHTQPLFALAFDPAGHIFASGGGDKKLIFWDVDTGEKVKQLTFTNPVADLCYSPDGKHLAIIVSPYIKILHSDSGEELHSFHCSAPKCLAYHPKGTYLAAPDYDITISVWDARSWEKLHTLSSEHKHGIKSVTVGPDEKTLISTGNGSDPVLRFWNIDSGKNIKYLIIPYNEQYGADIVGTAVDRDGKYFAWGNHANEIKILDMENGELVRTLAGLTGHAGWVTALSFSPDGKYLASGSKDSTLKTWDLQAGEEVVTFYLKTQEEQKLGRGFSQGILTISFSPDGKHVAYGMDEKLDSGNTGKTAGLWHVEKYLRVARKPSPRVQIIDLPNVTSINIQQMWRLQGHASWVNSVAVSPDETYLASGSDDQLIKLWDIDLGRERQTLQGHNDAVSSVCFHPDGNILASGGWDNTAILWELPSGKILRVLYGHTTWVNVLAFSPDGQILASADDYGEIRLWDAASGRQRLQMAHTRYGGAQPISSIAFSPNGRFLACIGLASQEVTFYDTQSGYQVKTFGQRLSSKGLAYRPDGKYIAAGLQNNDIELLPIQAPPGAGDVRKLSGHANTTSALMFSPDGKYLISGSYDHTVKIWDVETKTEIKTLEGHQNFVQSVAYSTNGKYIVSGSVDNTIMVWKIYG